MVALHGEIDLANADRVGAALNAAFGPAVGVVAADMSGIRFCDSSGIRELVLAHQLIRASNAVFQVPAGPGEVRRVPRILGLDTVLDLHTWLDFAL